MFSLTYEPTTRSEDLQGSEGHFVEVEWHIEVESDQAFAIVIEYSDEKLVSQFPSNLDRILVEVHVIDHFVDSRGRTIDDAGDSEKEIELFIPMMQVPEYYAPETVALLEDTFA